MYSKRFFPALASAACVLLFTVGHAGAQTASQLYNEATQNYEAGNTDAAKKKLRLALEVDRNFRPASALLARIAADEKQAGANTNTVSATSLAQTFVAVDFKDTTLKVAIEELRQLIAEKSGGKLNVNFVVQLPPDLAGKKVTLKLEHAPASEVMRYLASLAGVTFKVEQYAVTVTPAPEPTAKKDAAPAVPAATP